MLHEFIHDINRKEDKIPESSLCPWGYFFNQNMKKENTELLKIGVKTGLIIGVLLNSIFIILHKIMCNNLNYVVEILCKIIQNLGLLFIMPAFIIATILFGPLGERAPFLFPQDDTAAYNFNGEITMIFISFLSYFFIGIITQILYKKIKRKNEEYKKQK